MTWLHVFILIPFIFAIFVPLIYRFTLPRIHTGWFVLAVPFGIFLYLLRYIPIVSNGDNVYHSVPWIPSLGINYTTYIDGLGLIFGLLITGVGALVVLYSIYYMSKHREALHNFYVYLLLFMGAMLGLVFSDNILVLYVFWELTSISSFLLIAYWYQRKKSRYGAQKSMLITIFGGLAMLAGFIMLSMMTNTYSIREMISEIDVISTHTLFLPAMILILLGAFTKSAQFPFSIWLPDAMEAPTPVSAYLHSATMVKAGIYLVARFTPIFGGSFEWFWLVSGVGIITLIYGSITAVRQTDLKALLAYSTISQLGLIMSLLGLGSAAMYFDVGDESTMYAVAVLAAMFHLINHSTFKGSLFMVVGIVDHETGTRDIRKLGGLMSLMPISFTIAVIGSFAMAGLPPFNGFLSKEMFFTGVLNASELPIFGMQTFGIIFPIIAWVASVFTFIYCMILVFKTFTGKHQPEKLEKEAHEAPIGMLIPPIILASLVLVIFFFPNVLSRALLEPALINILPSYAATGGTNIHITAWHGFNTELFMTIGVVGFGALLYMYLKKWSWIYSLVPEFLTLNNAYNQGIEKMESLSLGLTKRYMTGFIRDYLVYIFAFFIIVLGGALWLLDDVSINRVTNAPISIYEAGLVIAMVIAALAVLFSSSRMTAIVAVGAIGYLVAILFVIFRAPDLALTQLVVETVTVALFLLCFYHLPEYKKEFSRVRFRLTNLIISLGVGATVTTIALLANGNRLFEPISTYFQDSYELAGARNMVNAILVDFRGMDTLLEILVLCIAGLGVYTLIKLRLAGRDNE
ncbi:Na+/H+ antiporter subunit A [Halalkalibacter nanhaiisediminis]|uniref:Multicomponent Na+:H+ antiporter subunit A n=1 Tax=Halalkalibacter nanhaiisediminis TaxID=688079 RepID=A0A562QU24_9BACI|nr:Na+/H+ antiporter subunit A [Halalkalibacter nanhaiisediminis]TWI59616.1 multicomponent Na+:H+ antiporter subunit A [Halalkalibacter nanhaiisediminis]